MDDFARIREDAAARVKERADAFEARVERGRQDIRDRIARVQFLQEEARRMQVLFNKGQNMVAAFYAELENLRPQITDELLGDWCFWNLGFSLNGLNRVAKIFDDANADRVRASLKKARLLEQEQTAEERARVAAEKAAQRAAEDEARRQREAEKAEAAAEAERRVALATAISNGKATTPRDLVIEVKDRILTGTPIREKVLSREFGVTRHHVRAAASEARAEIRTEALLAGIVVPEPPKKRGRRRNDSRDVLAEIAKEPPGQVKDSRVESLPSVGSPDLKDLASAIHAALARVSHVRSEWIEATLELANKLRQAKSQLGSGRFGSWMEAQGLRAKLSLQSQAALIGMGRDITETRAALEASDSWSWERIWKQQVRDSNIRIVASGDLDAPSQALH
jgi:hypothetical protein